MNGRKRFYALLLVVALLLSTVPAGIFAEGELASATALVLDEEQTVTLAEPGDVVWLTFTPEADGGYIFRSRTDEDVKAYIYDSEEAAAQEEYLYSDDDSGRDYNFSLVYDLEAGKTYYYAVEYVYDSGMGSVPVKVYRNPFKDIADATATVYENSDGEWDFYVNEAGLVVEYFLYDYMNYGNICYTMILTDDSPMEVNDAAFAYEGEYYEIWCSDEQNRQNHWYGGNTYTGRLEVAGLHHPISVTVTEPPVKSLLLDPIEVPSDNKTWSEYWDDEKGERVSYLRYYWEDYLSGTATMSDDSTVPIVDGCLEYEGESIRLTYKDAQGYSQPWVAGEENIGQVTCGSAEATVSVTVKDSTVPEPDPEPEPDPNPQPGEDTEIHPLTLDQEQTLTVAAPGEILWFSYTPEKTGVYNFGSMVERDTCAVAYDETFEYLAENDDGGEDSNFLIVLQMEAGKTYYFAARFWDGDETGPITVKLYENPIRSVTNATATVTEYVDGHWEVESHEVTGEDVPYFYYEFEKNAKYTVTFSDNSTQEVEGAFFEYDGVEYEICQDFYQDYANPWVGGNTYQAKMKVAGASFDIAVTVKDVPIKTAQVEPITIIEGADREHREFWNEDADSWDTYEAYDWVRFLTGLVTLEDGSTLEIAENQAFSDDLEIELYCTDDQSNTTQWTAGNTYSGKVRVGDLEVTVPVTIAESPVKKVEAAPVTLYGDLDVTKVWTEIEGEDGWEEVPYYSYQWQKKLQLTVTFADGSSVTTQPGQETIEYDGRQYEIMTEDEQSYEDQWQIGGNYTGKATVMGVEASVPVTVGPNMFQKIELDDITIMEGTCGNYSYDWDDEAGEEIKYYNYDWAYELDGYTVTLADGTEESGSLADIDYMDTEYDIYFSDEQSAKTPWTAGNTYSATVWLGIHEIPIKVTIEEAPVKSVEFQPVIMQEDPDGTYYWWNNLLYTITLKDGTTIMGDPNGFRYQGEEYWPETEDDQDEEPWGVGLHTGKVTLWGKEYSVPVYIGKKVDSGKYSYVLYENEAYLCDSRTGNASLTIPTKLDNKSVVGILSLGADLFKSTQVTIPNQITHLDVDAFYKPGETPVMEKLTVGSGVKYFSEYFMYGLENLETVVMNSNPYYYSTDGVVYNKAKTALVFYPFAKSDSHTILNSATDIEVLFESRPSITNLNVTLGTGTKDQYVQEDGIVFTKDKKTLMFCNSNKTGTYTLPATVTKLADGAFACTGFTSVTIHEGITSLPAYAFYKCKNLTGVDLPQALDEFGIYAFGRCTSLETFKLPEGITHVQYGMFVESGLISVYIPDSVEEIFPTAFKGTPLTTVRYGGTRNAWNQIYIYTGNEPLEEAHLYCKGETITGDLDDNGMLDTDDAVYLLLHALFGEEDYPVPAGTDTDFDSNGELDTDDAVYLLLHVLFGDEDYPLYG